VDDDDVILLSLFFETQLYK